MPLISVSDELFAHYEKIKQLRDDILQDEEENGSAKASVMNSLTRILNDMAKIQESIYNSERTAALHDAIVEALGTCDKQLQEKILDTLEERLRAL